MTFSDFLIAEFLPAIYMANTNDPPLAEDVAEVPRVSSFVQLLQLWKIHIVTCVARQRRYKRLLAYGHATIGRMFIACC
jgi:hypothetical protein